MIKVTPGALIAAILVGGILAGALDLVGACFIYKASPEVIGKAVAAGVLGPASFDGGVGNACLGASLHFFIATVAAAIYVLVSLRLSILCSQAVIMGVLFGVALFFAMNFIVAPLSHAATQKPFNWPRKVPDLIAHAAFFGPAVALGARGFLGNGKAA